MLPARLTVLMVQRVYSGTSNKMCEFMQAIYFPITDTTDPVLIQFELDLNAGTITLTFSEAVDVSSVDPTALTLASDLSSTSSITLTGGAVTSGNAAVLGMNLAEDDLNELKIAGICQTASSCYLSITFNFVTDLSGNTVVAILSDSALAVS